MGFLSDIIGAAAPIVGGVFGGPVGAAVGGLVGNAVGGSISNAGNNRANDQERAAAQAAQTAANPVSVFGPQGSAVFDQASNSFSLGTNPFNAAVAEHANNFGNQALFEHGNFQGQAFDVDSEVERLRQLRAPDIARARAQLQSQLLNRGRLGVGVGGGRSGQLFNPETAAQEEAILGAQLSDIGAAQSRGIQREALNFQREDQLLNQATGLFNLGSGLQGGGAQAAQIGIQARLPAGIAGLQAQPGINQASTTRSFFSGLGQEFSNTDFSGFFNQTFPDDAFVDAQGF